jgi:hypothetical protein
VDEAKLARWIAELDHPLFAVRERADRELRQASVQAEPALRRALGNRPSPEVRTRVQHILDAMPMPGSDPELLRAWRSVEVLETIATPAARQLLADLSRNAAGTFLANEAQGALTRLERRAAPP